MRRFILNILIILTIIIIRLAHCQDELGNIYSTKQDSLIDSYSVEELLRYRDYYRSELEILEQELYSKRVRGIKDALNFIQSNPNSKILDKIYMRLAEFYYDEAQDDYLTKMEISEDSVGISYEKAVANYDNVINVYKKVMAQFPNSELLDDAMFSLAFIYEDIGEEKKAIDLYTSLIETFTESRYLPDAYFRIAEYYFSPPQNNLEKAISMYKQILNFKDSPRYNEALYRLGWSYYRLNEYVDAVSYFTLLADDVERMKKMDKNQLYSNTQLGKESIEYIGISFVEQGGTEKAVEYLRQIGGRDYGVEILKKIGDTYKNEKESYYEAIEAYNLLLRLYPDNEKSPQIMESVVQCHQFLRNDMLAYLARNKLYETYKVGSEWWEKNTAKLARVAALQITERSLRENINLLYHKAVAANDIDLFRQATDDSRKYLKSFPNDSNSAQIHWNLALTLDTKLNDYTDAFDEYMKICDLYWGSKYQKFAAENAVALARDAVRKDTTQKKILSVYSGSTIKIDSVEVLSSMVYKKISLTPSEHKLVRAYDNYIRLFPHEMKTSDILSSAGILYYNNHHFKEALKYFNSKVKHFSTSHDLDETYFRIMESYFGKRDYKSCEIIAKKLKNLTSVDSTYIEKAKKRLAESIFLAAEILADSMNFLAAGNEHLRVVKEVPDARFADLSIFRASLEYEKAKEYRRAIETYNYLLETKPDSRYTLEAMNNLAIDYGEILENKNAAITFERLALSANDSLIVHDALFNSSIFYVRAEEWKNAIRVNENFVNKYPESDDADDLYFDMASYYLKLDELERANQIYGEYASRFPDSPRVVETYYHRGNYFRNSGQIDEAIGEYDKAVAKNRIFRQVGITSSDYFAAEALFNKMMIKFDEFRTIKFRLPEKNMISQKQEKKRLLKELINGLSSVVEFSTLRLYEATYFVGNTYEEFANSWAAQGIQETDRVKRTMKRKDINEVSEELYGRAEESFKESLGVLNKLADNYEMQMIDTDSSAKNLNDRIKYISRDSTLHVARKWIERCKDKVSEVIYDMAELNTEITNSFYNAPVPEELSYIEALEYNRQLLEKGVAPSIEKTMYHHLRNVKNAWNLGVENQWTRASRDKIINTLVEYGDRYYSIVDNTLSLLESKLRAYEDYLDSPQEDMNLAEDMITLIEFSRIFMREALEVDKNSIIKLKREGIADPKILHLEERMMKSVLEFDERCEQFLRHTDEKRKYIENLYKKTNKEFYENTLFMYEDNYFSLKETVTEILKHSYDISNKLGIKNKWSIENNIALVKMAPDEYVHVLNLEDESLIVVSDTSWSKSDNYVNGWIKLDFDDSEWEKAVIFNDTKDIKVADIGYPIWAGNRNSLIAESDSNMDYSYTLQDDDNNLEILNDFKNVYFRKSFFVKGLPVSASLAIEADESYNLFLNGEYIASYRSENQNLKIERHHELGEFLRSEKNVLAIEGIDEDLSGEGIRIRMEVLYIPDWDRERQLYRISNSKEFVKDNLVLDKYIIIN